MAFPRASGVLLHPTSLPGRFGIGDLGPDAHAFVDYLASAGQRLWQVLPLGPTGYGESPYQSLSAFAGNPLLISLDLLVEDGWLSAADVAAAVRAPSSNVDYERVTADRQPLWRLLLARLETAAASTQRERFERFSRTESVWLDDFALFMAIKEAHAQSSWTSWERDIAAREPEAMARWRSRLATEIRLHQLTQFLFFEQWQRLRAHCRSRGVELIGDLPIFVAHDSADVWARRDLFRLDADGHPSVVAGVPPDYFSATGQLWGNPHYDWPAIARTGFGWWIDRVRALLTLVDRIRFDHFRGFVASWEVPRAETTAIHGEWKPGPGAALFDAIRDALDRSPMPFVAENLGVITPEVEALRHRYDLPGMAILQFGFGTDPQAPDFRPHNFQRNLAAYTGTHDNDTTVGWWNSDTGHSTRSAADVERERDFAIRYLRIGTDVNWDLIRAVWASVADTAMAPAQDLLGLGSEARMNQPGTASGNWRWRLVPGQLTPAIAARLADLTRTFER